MDNKDLIIEAMTKQNVNLTALVQTLMESNTALTETVKDLQETIRELQHQLNQNSQNSSKPHILLVPEHSSSFVSGHKILETKEDRWACPDIIT